MSGMDKLQWDDELTPRSQAILDKLIADWHLAEGGEKLTRAGAVDRLCELAEFMQGGHVLPPGEFDRYLRHASVQGFVRALACQLGADRVTLRRRRAYDPDGCHQALDTVVVLLDGRKVLQMARVDYERLLEECGCRPVESAPADFSELEAGGRGAE